MLHHKLSNFVWKTLSVRFFYAFIFKKKSFSVDSHSPVQWLWARKTWMEPKTTKTRSLPPGWSRTRAAWRTSVKNLEWRNTCTDGGLVGRDLRLSLIGGGGGVRVGLLTNHSVGFSIRVFGNPAWPNTLRHLCSFTEPTHPTWTLSCGSLRSSHDQFRTAKISTRPVRTVKANKRGQEYIILFSLNHRD